MRMNRTVFELIRKNASRERQIDDVSYSGKKDMRALFKRDVGIGSKSQLVSGD